MPVSNRYICSEVNGTHNTLVLKSSPSPYFMWKQQEIKCGKEEKICKKKKFYYVLYIGSIVIWYAVFQMLCTYRCCAVGFYITLLSCPVKSYVNQNKKTGAWSILLCNFSIHLCQCIQIVFFIMFNVI